MDTEEAADQAATWACDCLKAKSERHVGQRIEAAKERVRELFGENAEVYGFYPLRDTEVITFLEQISEACARGQIGAATVKLRGMGVAKIGQTSKGKVKVERSETKSQQFED